MQIWWYWKIILQTEWPSKCKPKLRRKKKLSCGNGRGIQPEKRRFKCEGRKFSLTSSYFTYIYFTLNNTNPIQCNPPHLDYSSLILLLTHFYDCFSLIVAALRLLLQRINLLKVSLNFVKPASMWLLSPPYNENHLFEIVLSGV